MIPAVEGSENGCEMAYFGSNFGNDTPAWTRTYFEFYDWSINFLPKVCFGGATAPAVETPIVPEEKPAEDGETEPAAL